MAQRDRLPRSPRILVILTALFASLFASAAGCGDDGDPPTLKIEPAALSLAKGRTATVTAKADGRPAGAAVTWRAINPQVATVVEGDGGTATITAVGTGETKVLAKLEDVTATMIVTVSEAEIESIAITPALPQVAAGTSADLTATATLSDKTTRNVTAQVTWRSSDVAKATIDAAGKLRGLVKGPTTVTATLGALTATANATVTDAILTAIAVSPVNLTLPKGLTRQMTATGTFSDASTQDITNQVTWASSATANVTVSTSGVVTGAGVGTAMISATLSGVSGQVVVETTAAVLQSIAVTPVNSQLAKGLTRQFTATGTFSDATTQDLSATASWSSSDAAVATTSGRDVTAVEEGNATISASQDSITGTTNLEVTAAVITTIQVTPANSQLAKGLTRQFTATALLSDGSNMNVTTTATWESSDLTRVAISNADGSRGLATALLTGTVTLSATQGGVTGTTSLEVTPAALVSIAVEPATFTVQLGGTQQLTATGTFTDATTADLTDQVSWSGGGQVASVSQTGLVTGANPGEADITAALNGITGSAHVTVQGATLVSIAVTAAAGDLPVGLTRSYAATGTYSDGEVSIITDQVTWSSSDTDTAQISNAAGSHGLATAIAPGTATITAALNGVSGTASLTVVAVTLESITVTPSGNELPVGVDLQFTATGHFNNGMTQNLTTAVTWLSSNEAAATISNVDGSRGLARGVAIGGTTITATMDSITSNGATLNVVAPVITSIAVEPASFTIDVAATQQLTATATFSDGSTQDITATATWASSAAGLASVSATGLVTGVATGTTSITATQGGVTGTASALVRGIVSIAITPAGELLRGTSRALTATATFNDNTTLDVTQLADWSSSDTAAMTVTNVGTRGQVTAVTTAGATITATLAGISGSVAISSCALMINEVQTQGLNANGTTNSADEWVEIASTCTSDQSLTGLRIVYRSSTGISDNLVVNLSGVIPAGGYLFYVNNTVAGNYSGEAGTFTQGIARDGGGLGIRVGTSGGLLDSLGFGDATNAFVETAAAAAPSTTQSVARIPDKRDTNNNSTDFAVRTTKTPGAANQ